MAHHTGHDQRKAELMNVRIHPWEYVVPGLGVFLRGRRTAGVWCFLLFLVPLLFCLWRPVRIAGLFTGNATPDMLVAGGYLLFLLIGAFLWNYRMLQGMQPSQEDKGWSNWRQGVRHLWENRRARIGLGILIVLYSAALLAPLVTSFDPTAQTDVIRMRFLPPSLHTGHVLGTDGFGRDLLSRIVYGARISLSIGFLAVVLSAVIGTLAGVLAGYFGGWVDSLIMRLVDLMLGFPRLFLILIVIAFVGPSFFWVILVLGFTGWMGVARLVRAEVLSLKEREFIQAARALGLSTARIMARHLIPNTLAPILVFMSLTIGNVILIEAGLSFLGLGVQPPTPSWGNIINLGRKNLLDAWWISTFPGLAIVLTVLSFNMVGDALRDAFDPRTRREGSPQ